MSLISSFTNKYSIDCSQLTLTSGESEEMETATTEPSFFTILSWF